MPFLHLPLRFNIPEKYILLLGQMCRYQVFGLISCLPTWNHGPQRPHDAQKGPKNGSKKLWCHQVSVWAQPTSLSQTRKNLNLHHVFNFHVLESTLKLSENHKINYRKTYWNLFCHCWDMFIIILWK